MSKSTPQRKAAALLAATGTGVAAATYITVKTLVKTALDRKMPPIMEHS